MKAQGQQLSTTTKATRPRWNADGKDGPNDPNTSERILLKWLTSSSGTNYATYRGVVVVGPRGKLATTELQLCQEVSDKIRRAGVRCIRTPHQVMTKIEHLERQFRAARHHVLSDAGRRALMEDPRFYQCVIRRTCPHYESLRKIMTDSVRYEVDEVDDDELVGTTIEVPTGMDHYGEDDDEDDDDDDDDEEDDDDDSEGLERSLGDDETGALWEEYLSVLDESEDDEWERRLCGFSSSDDYASYYSRQRQRREEILTLLERMMIASASSRRRSSRRAATTSAVRRTTTGRR